MAIRTQYSVSGFIEGDPHDTTSASNQSEVA